MSNLIGEMKPSPLNEYDPDYIAAKQNDQMKVSELFKRPYLTKKPQHISLLNAWKNHLQVMDDDPVYALFPVKYLIREKSQYVAIDLLSHFKDEKFGLNDKSKSKSMVEYYSPTTILKLITGLRYVAQQIRWNEVELNQYNMEKFASWRQPHYSQVIMPREFILESLEILSKQFGLLKSNKPIKAYTIEVADQTRASFPVEGRVGWFPLPRSKIGPAPYVPLYAEQFGNSDDEDESSPLINYQPIVKGVIEMAKGSKLLHIALLTALNELS